MEQNMNDGGAAALANASRAAALERRPLMTWTDARIAELSRLWAAGVSASGIAEALGDDVSRSAVLGKLHRLKLLGSRKAASAPRRYDGPAAAKAATLRSIGAVERGPAPADGPSPPRSPWREAAFAPLAGTAPRPWLTRRFGECALPVGGEGEDLLSCCAPARRRGAYCAAHHAIVFKPASPATRAAEARQWVKLEGLAAERWAA
jgi:GcrA cell cycle regulator